MEIKSYAKVNVFLQICGKQDNYHLLASRFCLVPSLYDVIGFTKNASGKFVLKGDFACDVEQNTLYKAYKVLSDVFPQVEEFFSQFAIEVEKKIPQFGGLGGGSSNAAFMMRFVRDYLDLGISDDALAMLGTKVGADVPFFIYNYASANVSGIGEKVEKFVEEPLDFEVMTPPIECNTGVVFQSFREHFYSECSLSYQEWLFGQTSKDVLGSLNAKEANMLLSGALYSYPALQEYLQDGWYFSGSGSSFFRIKFANKGD